MIFAVACAAVGGSFGAALRSLFSSLLNDARGGFPFGTFASNMLSSFILGALMAFDDAGVLNKYADMLLEAGFCATLSTFSSLAWEMATMLRRGHTLLAAIYAISTFCGGMALFLAANHSVAGLY